MFPVGMNVDLYDNFFRCWRGSYQVMTQRSQTSLIKIKNLKTGSRQLVHPERHRKARLKEFRIRQ